MVRRCIKVHKTHWDLRVHFLFNLILKHGCVVRVMMGINKLTFPQTSWHLMLIIVSFQVTFLSYIYIFMAVNVVENRIIYGRNSFMRTYYSMEQFEQFATLKRTLYYVNDCSSRVLILGHERSFGPAKGKLTTN